MKKSYSVLAVFVLLALLFAAPLATSVKAKGDSKLLEWESMVGVPRPYTGAANRHPRDQRRRPALGYCLRAWRANHQREAGDEGHRAGHRPQ